MRRAVGKSFSPLRTTPTLTRVPPAPHVLFTHILPVPTQAAALGQSGLSLCARTFAAPTRKNTLSPPPSPLPTAREPSPIASPPARRPEWCVSAHAGCASAAARPAPVARTVAGTVEEVSSLSLSLKGLRARRPPHSPIPPSPFARAQVKRVGKYEIGKTLGEGTFGKVKYAVNTETGEKVRITDGSVGGDSLPRRPHTPGLTSAPPSPCAQVAIKILDKEKIQKQNMGAQIKKEVRLPLHSKFPSGVFPPSSTSSPSPPPSPFLPRRADLHHEDGQARERRQAV
jgi:hypothetical protein